MGNVLAQPAKLAAEVGVDLPSVVLKDSLGEDSPRLCALWDACSMWGVIGAVESMPMRRACAVLGRPRHRWLPVAVAQVAAAS